MTNLTKRHVPRRTLTFIALSSFAITALINACSSTDSNPSSGTAGTGGAGGSGGAVTAGSAGTQATAGSVNHGGSGGAAGSAGAVGTAGSAIAGGGGVGGTAGAAGTGGTAGGGGTGGVCAVGDTCCADPDKTAPGTCGCGVPENDSDGDGTIDCKPGHFLEAEDGVFSHVDVAVTPIDSGAGGAGGAGGVDGAGGAVGGADGGLPEMFTIGSDVKASKGKYIESPAGFTSDGLPGPARATYSFDIPVAKMYTIWGRFYTPSRDHNRFWVKVDDGVWTKLRVTTGETWFWYSFHKEGEFDIPTQYTLSKGAHTFAIASDSDGARVDRFYVTPNADRPTGDDAVCNPPHTVKIGDVCQESCGMLTGTSCDAVLCAGKTHLPAYDCDVCCTL